MQIDLITGFLGAGKTTFLLKYARFLMQKGLRIGILVYDHGALNVDMVMLSQLRGPKCELEMVAAACDEDCLRRRFQTKLISMAMSGYDRVIVEPTGLFDMDIFFDMLRDDPLEKWYEIGNVITIVNATLKNELDAEADFYLASQAASAGRIVLSRTQLATEEQIANVKEHISRAAEKIKCRKYQGQFMEKNWDDLTEEDFIVLSSCGYHICDYVKVTAGSESNFDSVSFLEVPKGLEPLKQKIKTLFANSEYGKITRVKGFVLDEQGCFEVNATEYEITAKKSTGQNVIIVIGNDLNKDKISSLIQGE